MSQTKPSLELVIETALNDYIKCSAKIVLEQAKKELEERVKENLASIVLKTQSQYSIENCGQELRITVNNDIGAK